MMKAIGFKISLAISLSKFGGSSSIPCAFLRRSFLKHLHLFDDVTERNENFWVVRVGISLVYSMQSPLCCCYTGEKLTKSIGDGFFIRCFLFVYFEYRTRKF